MLNGVYFIFIFLYLNIYYIRVYIYSHIHMISVYLKSRRINHYYFFSSHHQAAYSWIVIRLYITYETQRVHHTSPTIWRQQGAIRQTFQQQQKRSKKPKRKQNKK